MTGPSTMITAGTIGVSDSTTSGISYGTLLEVIDGFDAITLRTVLQTNHRLLVKANDVYGEYFLPELPNQGNDTLYQRNCIVINKRLTIGRKGDFIIRHGAISATHCVIWSVIFDDGSDPLVYIKDRSLNGTYINNQLMGPNRVYLLHHGDIIHISFGVTFKFSQLSKSCPLDTTAVQLINHSQKNWHISNQIIGHGSFGTVHVAVGKDLSTYAVKIIKPTSTQQPSSLQLEADILLGLHHPNIIKVHDVVIIANHVYIFQDLICGGDLFSYLCDGGSLRSLSESETIIIVFQLLQSLQYLHTKHIIHRDLKLDNVLLSAPIPGCKITLCDFGIATKSVRTNTMVGTIEYSAPEIFGQTVVKEKSSVGYNRKCDLWSLGIMIHIMITSISPFYSSSDAKIIELAQQCQLNFLLPQFSKTSEFCKSFIKGLITSDPEVRLDTNACFKHSWIHHNRRELEIIYRKILLESPSS